MLQDPQIKIVLNLTRPFEHYETTKAALLAGKHVYSEKPLAATYEKGYELVALAKEKNLMLGGAPDTFLGAGIQTCRKLIDDNFIGRLMGASARMVCHGHESWHPAPEFYYQNDGGPMMDMGPYYLTALVNLLGKADSLTGMVSKSFDTRTITTTFDVYYDTSASLEIYGTKGTLRVPDPNGFDGPVMLLRPESGTFKEIPLVFDYSENCRGLGLADMAKSIQEGRALRAGSDQMLHVLEIMTAFERSSREGRTIPLESPYERQKAMDSQNVRGIL